MSGFTFYENYYETLKKIRKRAERQAVALAMIEFIFEEKEPENLSEIGEIVFQSFRVSLEKSRQNARNSKKTNEKRIENESETKTKRNADELKTNSKRIPSFEERNKEDRNILTPIIPLKEGKGENFKKLFFKTYPAFKGEKNCDDSHVDYELLLKEFEQSCLLRGMYSLKKVCGMYDAIVAGNFRDKATPTTSNAMNVAGIEAKADRERWYAERRAAAEREAESVLKVFMQDEEFKRIHKRLNELQGEIGRTEAKAEMGDDKAVKQLVKLTVEQNRLTMQYRGIIERNGKTEEDLKPKWHCQKCRDTGWQEDGTACSCYEVE